MDNRPIGVFDSGLGGLTVVKELIQQLPNESIVYFGDTARIPYGTRSKETVTKYSAQCIRFLLTRNIKLIVIACNTASANSLEAMQDLFDVPILGVIGPGAEAAVLATRNNKIGIIGTEGTIRSKAYYKALISRKPDLELYDQACPLFVHIVEEGWSDTEIARLTAEKYLDNMKKGGVDTIVLGCTHYPLLTNTIRKVVGESVALINPAVGTAQEVKKLLLEKNMLRDSENPPDYQFYVSDFGQRFQQIGSRFLSRDIEYAEKVDIEKY